MQGIAGTGPKQAGCFAGASYGLSAPWPHGAELVLQESSARCALHPSRAALPLALMLWMVPLWVFFSLGIPQTSTTARGVMGMPMGTSAHTHVCTDTYMLKQVHAHSNFSSSLQTSRTSTPLPNKLPGHPVHPNFLQNAPSAVTPPASGRAKPYTLPLHPPSSVDAPHEDNPLGSPLAPNLLQRGDQRGTMAP